MFCFDNYYFFKYKTIKTHARAFLPLNISAIGTVLCVCSDFPDKQSIDLINYKANVNRFSFMNPFNNDRRGSVWVRDLKQVWLSCGAPMAFEW